MCDTTHCFIVPPHILEALARRGSVACKRALNDTWRILEKRNTALNNLIYRGIQENTGARMVYDSGNRYEQRLALVRSEQGSISSDPVVNAAYDNSGYVREYFRNTFGLNSIDNKGMPVISNVHYGINYNNAYWDGDEMTYGDGDGLEFRDFASAIDVVAHEITHGVTQFLANLEYFSQSGALNEHFSDVFATIIKQKYLGQQPSEADWLIGDEIVTGNFPGKAIRSLKAPGTSNDFDIQPDHMDRYYTGSSDNQGVHINSGIPNKAFYLAASELGMEDAGKIWFRCLKGLWRTAGFADMLGLIIDSCRQLSDEGEVDKRAEQVVAGSFSSVGLRLTAV